MKPKKTTDSQHQAESLFVIQKVQPALLGLMDGSVSTMAPIFAAAGLTGKPLSAFFVGLAASLGAGISMGLAEGLSDDGSVTGRGKPLVRGAITGIGTAVGGMLHTFPFLIPHLKVALHTAYIGHENKTYEIAVAESYSFYDIAEQLTELSGKQIHYAAPDAETFSSALKQAGVPDDAIMGAATFCQAIAAGEFDFPDTTLEQLIGRKPETLKDFLRKAYRL